MEAAMRELGRRTPLKTRATKARRPEYDPYSSHVVDDSPGWVGPLPVKVVSLLDLTEDVRWSGIQRGMRVLELGCGGGDVSLWIAKLVGPTGLVLGIDESAERIDLAEKRATVAGQCYWTRFVTADLNTFIPHERFDVVIMRRAYPLPRERATFLRLSTWLRPEGVIIIMAGEPAGSADKRSLIRGK
jgi:2-polyprenyl-3-methyl-5-hydroxy-6-metoxy-1,4-benzoquinol methylase